MRRLAVAFAAALLLGAPAAHAAVPPPGVAPAYRIVLRASADGRSWRGTETLSFANASNRPLSRVWLRLWDNGIAGCTDPLPERVGPIAGGAAGPMAAGCSALAVDLDHPLAPGRRATLGFPLAVDVPDRADRFGHLGAQVLVGNAVPLLAVRRDGRWDLDPYSILGDSFVSDIGTFSLTLDTPAAMGVAATGAPVRDDVAGGRRLEVFDAPRVRDVAWVVGPMAETDVATADGVRIRVWIPDDDTTDKVANLTRRAVGALTTYEQWYGRYPYPELDVVMTPQIAFGGMEYPNLIMARSGALAHEIAHQWWYGMVGDDQYRSPWLDEAFATYTDGRHAGWLDDLCAGPFTWKDPREAVTDGMGWWDAHPTRYSPVVYVAGACTLHDLERVLGSDAMLSMLRAYIGAHRYGWSTTTSFARAAQAATTVNLAHFWRAHRVDLPAAPAVMSHR